MHSGKSCCSQGTPHRATMSGLSVRDPSASEDLTLHGGLPKLGVPFWGLQYIAVDIGVPLEAGGLG